MDTYLADGITPAQRHFLVIGNLTAGKVGKLTSALVTAFGVHLNHYRTGSCESWLHGKMLRGRADTTRIHGWNSFREIDRFANKVRDNELARKRGTQWTVMLGNISWTWSTRGKSGRAQRKTHARAALPRAEASAADVAGRELD